VHARKVKSKEKRIASVRALREGGGTEKKGGGGTNAKRGARWGGKIQYLDPWKQNLTYKRGGNRKVREKVAQ